MSNFPFRIKICGVKADADVLAVADAGGDAVGLNCFPASKRYVSPDVGRPLCELARGRGVLPIALFVNSTLEQILEIAELWSLSHIQLHGDESMEFVTEVQRKGLQVVRAVRLATGLLEPDAIERQVKVWEQLGCAILLDADVGSAYGGAGAKLDWHSIGAWKLLREAEGRPVQFALAGGLVREDLSSAIRNAMPSAIDVASGVEKEKGVKHPLLIKSFCGVAAEEFLIWKQGR